MFSCPFASNGVRIRSDRACTRLVSVRLALPVGVHVTPASPNRVAVVRGRRWKPLQLAHRLDPNSFHAEVLKLRSAVNQPFLTRGCHGGMVLS